MDGDRVVDLFFGAIAGHHAYVAAEAYWNNLKLFPQIRNTFSLLLPPTSGEEGCPSSCEVKGAVGSGLVGAGDESLVSEDFVDSVVAEDSVVGEEATVLLLS